MKVKYQNLMTIVPKGILLMSVITSIFYIQYDPLNSREFMEALGGGIHNAILETPVSLEYQDTLYQFTGQYINEVNTSEIDNTELKKKIKNPTYLSDMYYRHVHHNNSDYYLLYVTHFEYGTMLFIQKGEEQAKGIRAQPALLKRLMNTPLEEVKNRITPQGLRPVEYGIAPLFLANGWHHLKINDKVEHYMSDIRSGQPHIWTTSTGETTKLLYRLGYSDNYVRYMEKKNQPVPKSTLRIVKYIE